MPENTAREQQQLSVSFERIVADLIALGGEWIPGRARAVSERLLRENDLPKIVDVTFTPREDRDGDIELVGRVSMSLSGIRKNISVKLLLRQGIKVKVPHPLLSGAVPCLVLSPPMFGKKRASYYPVIPLGMGRPELVVDFNTALKAAGQPEIELIEHRLFEEGSFVFAFTPPYAKRMGEDKHGNEVWKIGRLFGDDLYLDRDSSFIPTDKDGDTEHPAEAALAVERRLEGRLYVSVIGRADEVDLRRKESSIQITRTELDPYAMLGLTLDQFHPDPFKLNERWSVSAVFARAIKGGKLQKAAIKHLISVGVLKVDDTDAIKRHNAIESLRRVEPQVHKEVREYWRKILKTKWEGYEFPTQSACVGDRPLKAWHNRAKDDDIVAPLVAKRMSELAEEEVAFEPRNPWHRALRSWILKNKCEKDLRNKKPVDEEPPVPPENEVDQDPPETEGTPEE